MSSKICTVCGAKVEIPKKINNDGQPFQVKCKSCGAVAPLRIRQRNGSVRGLKGCFVAIRRFPRR